MRLFHFALLATTIVLSGGNCMNQSASDPKSHESAMAELFPKPTHRVKSIGILLYDGFTTLDAMGPFQVLGELTEADVFFVAQKTGMVKNNAGLEIQVTHSFDDTDSLDILLIPGGFKETYLLQRDTELLNWVRKIDKTTVYTASVCTGAWVLAATGLLQGKNATTHWYGKDILKDYGIQVKNERWVRDGKYWTSAGVTAGMDMCLAIIADIRGENYTKAAMLDLEYDPQPPFKGGSDHNTDQALVDMMRQVYDAGLKPAKDSLMAH